MLELVEQCHAASRTLTDCNDEVDAEGGVRTPDPPPGYATDEGRVRDPGLPKTLPTDVAKLARVVCSLFPW